MSDWPWVIASYALTWLVLAAYVVLVHRRLARARSELEVEREKANDFMERES